MADPNELKAFQGIYEKLARENEERTAGNKKEAEDRKKGTAPQA